MQVQHKLQATSDHVAYCFDTLLAHYAGSTVGTPSFEDFCWSGHFAFSSMSLRALEAHQLALSQALPCLQSSVRDLEQGFSTGWVSASGLHRDA